MSVKAKPETERMSSISKILDYMKGFINVVLYALFLLVVYGIVKNLTANDTGVSFDYLDGETALPSVTFCPASILDGEEKSYPIITKGSNLTMQEILVKLPSMKSFLQNATLTVMKDYAK